MVVESIQRIRADGVLGRRRVPKVDPVDPRYRGQKIYVFWHENILIPAYQYRVPSVRVLISQHADGELIAQTAQRLGFGVVRGSSTRGGGWRSWNRSRRR